MNNQRLINIYSMMFRIRKFEERAHEMFLKNMIAGNLHLYLGQEAIAATVCSHLRDNDYITSTHRGHGHCIAKGARTDRAMAELLGKETGYCKGRGGSMHIADLTKGNLGANPIVGGGIPIGTGGALAAKLKKTDQVCVVFFGDGASNQGTFHESINLASIWKLPAIYVIENNLYAISSSYRKTTSVENIGDRAAAYGIPGRTVDGNDIFAIDAAITEAIERARAGNGPTIIECKTYRHIGHWVGDSQVYRTKEEVEHWKSRCPVKAARMHILDSGVLSEDELEAIESGITAEIDEAERFAVESPNPEPSSFMEYVYV